MRRSEVIEIKEEMEYTLEYVKIYERNIENHRALMVISPIDPVTDAAKLQRLIKTKKSWQDALTRLVLKLVAGSR